MLNKKELIKNLKKFSKFTIVSLASLTLIGGSLNNTASAKSIRHNHYSRRVNKNNYQSLVNYLNWVHHYDHTHKNNWHSYKLAHLYKYMSGLTNNQYRNIEALFNKNHNLYYHHDSSMKNDSEYFKNTDMNISKITYKHLVHMFHIDSINQDSKNDNALNRYLSHNWHDLTDSQLENLSHSYNIDSFLNTDYNLHEFHNFNKRYTKKINKENAEEEARFTATNKVNELAQQDSEFDTETRANLINDINNSRMSYGLNPLTVTNAMQVTADYRDPKVQYAIENLDDYKLYPHNTSNPGDNWVHGVDTHTTASEYLVAHHYKFNECGSNAGEQLEGNNNAHYYDGSSLPCDNTTPEGDAYNINNGLMNHDVDEGNNNCHRDIELNKNFKYLGVGVVYNPVTHIGTYNEQFAC